MATRTQSRHRRTVRNRSSATRPAAASIRGQRRFSQDRSAFSWGDSAGPRHRRRPGRRGDRLRRQLRPQGADAGHGGRRPATGTRSSPPSTTMALAIFDKMLATDETQTFKRKMLLMKLTHALDKHAHEEEMVVYPALREANEAGDADHLESEHGYIKTFIYELNEMGPDVSDWLEKVREFRAAGRRARAYGGGAGLPALQARHERGAERARSPASSTATASGWLERLADEGELRRLLDREIDAPLAGDPLDRARRARRPAR